MEATNFFLLFSLAHSSLLNAKKKIFEMLTRRQKRAQDCQNQGTASSIVPTLPTTAVCEITPTIPLAVLTSVALDHGPTAATNVKNSTEVSNGMMMHETATTAPNTNASPPMQHTPLLQHDLTYMSAVNLELYNRICAQALLHLQLQQQYTVLYQTCEQMAPQIIAAEQEVRRRTAHAALLQQQLMQLPDVPVVEHSMNTIPVISQAVPQ